jgi:hypothetical protein
LYCVIDQEQQSTGQFRAALSRGLEHAIVKKKFQPQPPAAEETNTRLPAVTTLLEPIIPQKECSRRNGARIKGPTPTPSPSPHPQARGRRRSVPAEAPTAQPPLPRGRLVAVTRQRPMSVPGPGDSHRQVTPDRDHPPYRHQRPSDGRRACRPWRPRVANAGPRRRLPSRMSSRFQTRSTRSARPVCVGMPDGVRVYMFYSYTGDAMDIDASRL